MEGEPRAGPPAPLLRRWWACAIDAFALALVGIAVGLAFGKHLGGPGSPSRLIGLPIAVAYLGLAGSRLAGGQTAGSSFMHLKVVGHDGRPLGVPRALLRALVLTAPWFFDGLQLSPATPFGRMGTALAGALMFGIAPASLLLGLASPGRQFLHDLAAGSFVIEEEQDAVPLGSTPRWAVLLASSWIPVIAVANVILSWRMPEPSRREPIEVTMLDIRGVERFDVTPVHVARNGEDYQILRVLVATGRGGEHGERVVRRAAAVVVALHPQLNQFREIQVQSVSGVDVGLVRWNTGDAETHSPEEWRALVGAEALELLRQLPSQRGK